MSIPSVSWLIHNPERGRNKWEEGGEGESSYTGKAVLKVIGLVFYVAFGAG